MFLQIVSCRVLKACHGLEPYTIRFVSSGRFIWSASQLYPTLGGRAIFKFLHLFTGQVPSDCFLQSATSMPQPRALYHSIRLVRRIQMVRIPTLSDRWWWSYLVVCTFVHRARTFGLFAAECYKHATASSLIPLNSSRRAESNDPPPRSGTALAVEL